MTIHHERLARLQQHMSADGVDAALVGVGSDLEYLTGYRGHPSERLTMLVVGADLPSTLVVPQLEAMEAPEIEGVVVRAEWCETADPVRLVAELLDGASAAAVSDDTWARFALDIQRALPSVDLGRLGPLIAQLRVRKGSLEIAALRAVGACVDQVLGEIQAGRVDLVGRTERQIAQDVTRLLLEAGHDTVAFCIVAAGPNASAPHHAPGDRVVVRDELVLFDIGGRKNGYSSDSTRCVATGRVPSEVADAYGVLRTAQAAGVDASVVGETCEGVDRAARAIIDDAGWGAQFIHRTGHGIGLDGHEEPYVIAGNARPLEAGFAFSVEPGIYADGRWGMRIEDIVVVTDGEPIRCNQTSTELIVV